MKKSIYRDSIDNLWKPNYPVKSDPFKYQASLIKYLNAMDPFFVRAKAKCEFEFIMTLIRVDGLKDAGWDPLETLEDVLESFKKISTAKTRNDQTVAHFALFTYGLIIEASAPYDLLANLLNVMDGDRYSIRNFPDYKDQNGRVRSQSPQDKLAQLKSKAKKQKLNLDFFDEFMDSKLRNAVFHTDYVIYWPEIRTMNPAHRYSHQEWMELLNKVLAYIEALLSLYKNYIGSYTEPKIIDPHPGFQMHPQGKAVTIIREGHGVIGLKDNWTKEEIAKGMIPFYGGHFLPYEQALLDKDQIIMPPNKIEKFNNTIKFLPRFMRRYLIKKFKGNFGIK